MLVRFLWLSIVAHTKDNMLEEYTIYWKIIILINTSLFEYFHNHKTADLELIYVFSEWYITSLFKILSRIYFLGFYLTLDRCMPKTAKHRNVYPVMVKYELFLKLWFSSIVVSIYSLIAICSFSFTLHDKIVWCTLLSAWPIWSWSFFQRIIGYVILVV